MGGTRHSTGGAELCKKSCSSRRKKANGKAKTKMGRRRDGGCKEVGGEKLEECCKEQRHLAEVSKEGLGSKRVVVPMMMTMMMMFVCPQFYRHSYVSKQVNIYLRRQAFT